MSELLPAPPGFPPAPGSRWLLVAPHPDDETLGGGGLLRVLQEAGAVTGVLLATDGNRRGLGRFRTYEFRQALDVLGVAPDQRFRLEFPDGRLASQPNLRAAVAQSVRRFQADRLLGPLPQDRHPDHAVLGRLLVEWSEAEGIPYLGYLIHARGYPQPRRRRPQELLVPPARVLPADWSWSSLPLSREHVERKEQALRCHRTQLWAPTLRGLLFGLIRSNELFAFPRTGPVDQVFPAQYDDRNRPRTTRSLPNTEPLPAVQRSGTVRL